jgi:hypothetical protein
MGNVARRRAPAPPGPVVCGIARPSSEHSGQAGTVSFPLLARLYRSASHRHIGPMASRTPPLPLGAMVQQFVDRLTDMVRQTSAERVKALVLGAVGLPPKRGPGRPPKDASAVLRSTPPRKKAPRQLCPVPGCLNPAAPVYGMVCAKHKDVPKAKIKQYREARRLRKAAGKPGSPRAKSTASRPGRRPASSKKAARALPVRRKGRSAAPSAQPSKALRSKHVTAKKVPAPVPEAAASPPPTEP